MSKPEIEITFNKTLLKPFLKIFLKCCRLKNQVNPSKVNPSEVNPGFGAEFSRTEHRLPPSSRNFFLAKHEAPRWASNHEPLHGNYRDEQWVIFHPWFRPIVITRTFLSNMIYNTTVKDKLYTYIPWLGFVTFLFSNVSMHVRW